MAAPDDDDGLAHLTVTPVNAHYTGTTCTAGSGG
jgi:hypothetical protein